MASVFSYTNGMSNGFFIQGKQGVIAVDTGCIEGENIVKDNCHAAGIVPTDVKLIIITHGHVDHFFNLNALRKLTGAPVLCHMNAARFIENGLLPEEDIEGRTPLGVAILEFQAKNGSPVDSCPKSKVDIQISEDYDLTHWGVEGSVILTPGHSRGCVSVVLKTGEAIIGDLFAAPAGEETGRTSYFQYVGAPFEEVDNSLEKILNIGVRVFYSGHGGPYSRKQVKQCVAEDRRQQFC